MTERIIYHDLAKAIALRAGQIVDAVAAADIETAYSGPLADLLAGVEVPYSALKRDILAAEALVASMIGESSNIQLRAALVGEGSVASGDQIPTDDDQNRPFVGKFDGLFSDGDDLPIPLRERSVVMRAIRNSGGFLRLNPRGYCLEGSMVFFSNGTSDAYFRGVCWSRQHASDQYDVGAAGKSVMPPQVELLWQDIVLGNMAQENFFENEAAGYRAMAADNAQAIGLTMDPATASDAIQTNTENDYAKSENR
jgi:hypothetical protein